MIPKFRAWDKRKNDMRDVAVLHFNKNGKVSGVEYWKTPYDLQSIHANHIILMQYTGLKDKNGVVIFEGDVVLLDVNNGFDYVDNKAFVVQESRYHSGLVCADPSSEMEYRIFNKDSVGGYSYEVIGNIHETPELLKEDGIRE